MRRQYASGTQLLGMLVWFQLRPLKVRFLPAQRRGQAPMSRVKFADLVLTGWTFLCNI